MIDNFYLLAIGTGLIVSLISLNKNSGKERLIQKVIIGVLFWVLIIESIGSYTAAQQINNSIVYNLGFVFIESFLLIYYFSLLEVNKRFKKKIWIYSGILLIWGVLNSLIYQPIDTVFQFFTFLPFSLLIIFLALRFLVQLMKMKTYANYNLVQLPHFWISWMVILFYVEALFLFGSYQFYPDFVVENLTFMFTFNQLIAGLMYVTFGFSFVFPLISPRKLPLI